MASTLRADTNRHNARSLRNRSLAPLRVGACKGRLEDRHRGPRGLAPLEFLEQAGEMQHGFYPP
ncbi:hypothetical protein CTI14_64340, partial [Methylobacterium radiotolerans]